MAHAYTPGLRVTAWTEIVKTRRLPLKGEVLVRKGDAVTSETIVAKTELPGNVQPIKAASILSIPPEDLPHCMLKKEGDPVEKGEIIATSKSFFGLFKSHCRANCNGTVESISNVTGQIILREPPIPVQVEAYIDGTVTNVMESEGVEVTTQGAFIQGIFGIGGETWGELKIATLSPTEVLTEAHVDGNSAEKVLVGGSQVTVSVLRKAVAAGVRAVVVGGFDEKDLRDFLGHDLGVAITGSEQLGLTLVVTEGFGQMNMAERTFELLRRFEGRKVSVNGATQIRAGVLRPEIVIPLAVEEKPVRAAHKADVMGGLKVGSLIRAIRAPYFGRLGEVIELPPALKQLETEAKVRILKVRFQDGTEAVVPRANVEMIEM